MTVAIVHYHLRPGGVSRVIAAASQALESAGIAHIILIGEAAPPEYAALPVRIVEGLGYLSEPGKLSAETLRDRMESAARTALGHAPDIWHFHNHSLGKNALIAAVTAAMARDAQRLVLQIHDRAEDGRPGNFPLIASERMLYPAAPRVRLVFLNHRDREDFTVAGMPESFTDILENPVPPGHHRAPTAGRPPLVLYPVRGIRRKNPAECLLLAAHAPEGTRFAITRAPDNPRWLPGYDAWRTFAARHGLRVGFEVADRLPPADGAGCSFADWMEHATHILSTSVAEGFGFAFLDALARGKPLLGRDLPAVTRDHADHGITHDWLYEHLEVPAAWIDETTLRSHLADVLRRRHLAYGRALPPDLIERTFQTLKAGDGYDFGNLPESFQLAVLSRIMESTSRQDVIVHHRDTRVPLGDWLRRALAAPFTGAPGALAAHSPGHYRARLTNIYNSLMSAPEATVSAIDPQRILDACLSPQRFHFLTDLPPPAGFPIKAAIFDIYGTLLIAPAGGVKPDPSADPAISEILRRHGLHPPDSPSRELHEIVRRHHAASPERWPEIDLREMWRELLNIPPGTDLTALVIELEKAWHPASPMPGAAETLARLDQQGIALGLLSNAQCNTLSDLGEMAGFFDPHLTVLSYQHALAKPTPGLFEIVRARLDARGISPDETIYIGNDPMQDIAPASAAGFRTALFIGHPDSLREGHAEPDHILKNLADI